MRGGFPIRGTRFSIPFIRVAFFGEQGYHGRQQYDVEVARIHMQRGNRSVQSTPVAGRLY